MEVSLREMEGEGKKGGEKITDSLLVLRVSWLNEGCVVLGPTQRAGPYQDPEAGTD